MASIEPGPAYPRPAGGPGRLPPPPPGPTLGSTTRDGPCECGGWQTCVCAVPVAELRLYIAQLADLHAPAPSHRYTIDFSRCRTGEPLVTCPVYRRLSRLNGLRWDRTRPAP